MSELIIIIDTADEMFYLVLADAVLILTLTARIQNQILFLILTAAFLV